MSKRHPPALAGFPQLLKEIKARIQQAQTRAMLSVNAELVRLYWDIGRMVDERQSKEGWGAAVIPRLARELQNELAEEKGFSERNIGRMIAFYRSYPNPIDFLPQPVAKLPVTKKVPQPAAQISPASHSLLWAIPWGHHALLIEKVGDLSHRRWYMEQTLANGWSRNVLLAMIKSDAHLRQGGAVTNFDRVLPSPQSDLARQMLKDPYVFDFLTLEEPFHQRELETNLLRQLERFLLELGQGFAFVGRQYHLEVGDSDFYIDLLFHNLKLRCYVVIDVKTGEFKAEYSGKMNFYLSVVDDQLRHCSDAPSIGLILCQERDQIVAEYALRDVNKPIGISEYELTRALPPRLRSALPSVEEIESELSDCAREPVAIVNQPASDSDGRATAKLRESPRKQPAKEGRKT